MSKSNAKMQLEAAAAEAVAESAKLRAAATASAGDGTAATISENLQNTTLGEFRLLRRLGHGGMAEVYLAEQTSLQRNVAIKILRKELVTDETYLKRFKTEAMAAGGLNHPNIVQVYAIGEVQGVHYIVQEYVQGQNLREHLARKGPPDTLFALHVMKQVASALKAAGDAGIVHRDIKPENIMLTRKGEVKVTDFGLAQLTQAGERVNLTQVGITMGTPLYMSPEQVNGSKLDQRSDIYSFGVTCYHMLTGSPPFRGETALSVAVQHLKYEPEPLEQSRPDLPPALCRIVHKMMAKDREQRYPNARAVIKDLKPIAQELGGPAAHSQDESAASQLELQTISVAMEQISANRFHSVVASVLRKMDRPARNQALAFVVALVVAAGVAAGSGWVTRTANPLDAPPAESKIERKASAKEQFYLAHSLMDNEAAWKAVYDYFSTPADVLEARRAKQNLARLYLRQRRYDDSLAIFNELAGLTSEPEFQAFGLAGQVVVYNLRGEYRKSLAVWTTLRPLYKHLTEKMPAFVQEAYRRNHEALDSQMDKQDEDLFKDVPDQGDAATKRTE